MQVYMHQTLKYFNVIDLSELNCEFISNLCDCLVICVTALPDFVVKLVVLVVKSAQK